MRNLRDPVTESLLGVYIDPVQELNSFLSRYKVLSDGYYYRERPLLSTSSEAIEEKQKKRKFGATYENARVLSSKERHEILKRIVSRAFDVFCGVKDLMLMKTDTKHSVSFNSEGTLDLVELSLQRGATFEVQYMSTNNNIMRSSLVECLVENQSDQEVIASTMGHHFVIPRKASFFVSDIAKIDKFQRESLGDFNLVLIDPPWENKSVKRRSEYPTIPNRNLFSLPVKKLCSPKGALVALWVTNKEKLLQFVEEELFPHWGVKLVATWLWLKIDKNGTPISNISNEHHRPYEILVMGHFSGDKENSSYFPEIPENFVIISVPGEHSRKPPIAKILEKYTPNFSHLKPVELFAREMLPGWTTWGNETLKFQDVKYFVTTK